MRLLPQQQVDQHSGLGVGRGAIKPSEMFPACISAAGLYKQQEKRFGNSSALKSSTAQDKQRCFSSDACPVRKDPAAHFFASRPPLLPHDAIPGNLWTGQKLLQRQLSTFPPASMSQRHRDHIQQQCSSTVHF